MQAGPFEHLGIPGPSRDCACWIAITRSPSTTSSSRDRSPRPTIPRLSLAENRSQGRICAPRRDHAGRSLSDRLRRPDLRLPPSAPRNLLEPPWVLLFASQSVATAHPVVRADDDPPGFACPLLDPSDGRTPIKISGFQSFTPKPAHPRHLRTTGIGAPC